MTTGWLTVATVKFCAKSMIPCTKSPMLPLKVGTAAVEPSKVWVMLQRMFEVEIVCVSPVDRSPLASKLTPAFA